MSARRAVTAIKLTISVIFLAYLLATIGWSSILELFGSVRPALLLIPFALLAVGSVIRSYNWAFLLATLGARLPFREVLYSHVVGTFAGAGVPSGLGTDLARAITLNRQHGVKVETASSSTIALNIANLLGLFLIAFGGALALLGDETLRPFSLAVLATTGSGIALAGLGLAKPEWSRRLTTPIREAVRRKEGPFFRKLGAFMDDLAVFRGRSRAIGISVAIAVISKVVSIAIAYLIAVAVDARVSFLYFLAFFPVVAFARLLPISVAGFGGEQGLFVLMFRNAGMLATEAFVVSLLVSSLKVVYLMSCGLVYILATLRGLLRGALTESASLENGSPDGNG